MEGVRVQRRLVPLESSRVDDTSSAFVLDAQVDLSAVALRRSARAIIRSEKDTVDVDWVAERETKRHIGWHKRHAHDNHGDGGRLSI
jgi:hypothetical protein